MKASNLWDELGRFNFTHLYQEVESIKLEVEDMDDHDLVDEVAYLGYTDGVVDQILYDFVLTTRLTPSQRDILINFYVIANIEDLLMVMEDGEW